MWRRKELFDWGCERVPEGGDKEGIVRVVL